MSLLQERQIEQAEEERPVIGHDLNEMHDRHYFAALYSFIPVVILYPQAATSLVTKTSLEWQLNTNGCEVSS